MMWNHASHAGLLVLFLSALLEFTLLCLAQDVHHLHRCEAAVGVDSPRMALRYTARQLLNLKGNLDLANDIRAVVLEYCDLCVTYIARQGVVFLCSTSKPVAYPAFLRKPQRLLFRPTGLILITYPHSSVWRLPRTHLLPRVY